MLRLTFKNRTLMVIDRLINEAGHHEFGIVKEIELTTSDLFQMITEIDAPEFAELRKDFRGKFKVESEDNTANLFDFFALKTHFVDKWFEREYDVTYKGVPLRLLKENRAHLQS